MAHSWTRCYVFDHSALEYIAGPFANKNIAGHAACLASRHCVTQVHTHVGETNVAVVRRGFA